VEGGSVNWAEQALWLREVGRAHKWGHYLYEVLRGPAVVAKIAATPEDALRMLAALDNNRSAKSLISIMDSGAAGLFSRQESNQ
jgi:hypothetical protein